MSLQKVVQNLRTLKKRQIPNPTSSYVVHPKAKIGDTIINCVLNLEENSVHVLSKLTPSLVHLIVSDPHIHTPKCLHFFNFLALHQSLLSFNVSLETHLSLVCRLIKAKQFQHAEDLLFLLLQRCPFTAVASFFENHDIPSKIASKIFNLLIKVLSDNGKFKEASEIFMYMKQNAIEISERTCTVHLIELVKFDQIELAVDFFNKMVDSGIMVSVFSLTVVVDGLCKCGEIQRARELVEVMVFKGVKPNIITCNTLVDACAKRWDFKEMDRVLAFMKREQVNLNAETYKFLVDGFLSSGNIDDAEKLVLEMYVKGFKVDIHLYNLMIKGCCRLGNMERALSLFRQMIEKDICPNIDTYSYLIKGHCAVGKVNTAKEPAEEMRQGFELNQCMFDILIDCYFEAGMIDEAFSLLAWMDEKGSIADVSVSVYELLIERLLKLDRTEEAIYWLTTLIKRGVPLDNCLKNLKSDKLVHGRREKDNDVDLFLYPETISLSLGKQQEDAHFAE